VKQNLAATSNLTRLQLGLLQSYDSVENVVAGNTNNTIIVNITQSVR